MSEYLPTDIQKYIHISKYSRWRHEWNRRETWEETVDRYIDFWKKQLGDSISEDTYNEIRENILTCKVMPSMRTLMTAGKALERDHIAGYNPVVGTTKVLTKEYGYVQIKELENKSCHVLNINGEWAYASFKCYGVQEIYEVELRKNSNTIITVECSDNHRWYTTNGEVKPTIDLLSGRNGDKLPYASWKRPNNIDDIDYKIGLIHGLIFGDGTGQYTQERLKGYSIRICSDIEDTLRLFEDFDEAKITYPESFNGDPVVQLYGTLAKTHDLKSLPSDDETDSYMIGFFRGWLAADGTVGKSVSICLNEDYFDWFLKNSAKYGYVVQHTREFPNKTNFGKRKKRAFEVVIDRTSLTHEDFILPRKRDKFNTLESRFSIVSVKNTGRKELVYCAEVPDTNTFVLEKGLVTGNCTACAITHPAVFSEAFYILMNGCGFGFSVERQYINKLPEVAEELYPTETTIIVRDSKIGWATALKELISMLYNGQIPKWDLSKIRPAGAILKTFGGRACLTGDTILSKDRKKSREENEITIKELYDMERSEGFWKHKPNHFKDVKIRSLDEETGEFYRNNVITVIDNGVAPVYEIVTKNGYKIKATLNHRFMDSSGNYRFLEDFKVGMDIAVNGSDKHTTGKCVDCGCHISRNAKRCVLCNDINQQKDDCNDTTARQRKACREYKKEKCEICGQIDDGSIRFERHHIDHNPRNNDHDNLLYLCVKCHQKEEAKYRTFGDRYSHRYISYDEIVSIEYAGEERVYDLQMEAPNHNFVANGFVSHNSGPQALDTLLKQVVKVFQGAKGRKLTSIECHDIICYIAEAVIVGSVRRSATISMSNLTDDRMRRAKDGQWWFTHPQRAMANNSVAYTEKPDIDAFSKEWRTLYKSKSGERGIWNKVSARKKAEECGREVEGHDFITNPCGETILRDTGSACNLSEVIIRPDDDFDTIKDKIRIATIIGTMQATLTNFRFLRKIWKNNIEEERLLGVSLTGIMDHVIFSKQGTKEDYMKWTGDRFYNLDDLLSYFHEYTHEVNKEYAKKLGIPATGHCTVVKPSGTVSILTGTSSGIHPRYGKYYIRRVRNDKKDPLSQLMIDEGIPYIEEGEKYVFSFYVKSPDHSVIQADIGAMQQLDVWKSYKEHWCDGNPSQTIYYTDDDYFAIADWLWRNWDIVGGISFFPYSGSDYPNAPLEVITEDEYNKAMETFPKNIRWDRMPEYEKIDTTTSSQEVACSGGACEL